MNQVFWLDRWSDPIQSHQENIGKIELPAGRPTWLV